MKTTLTIIRHGETDWNRLGRLQGQLNSPLTQAGIEAAEALRREITDIKPDVVYSSDQERALMTAEILTKDLQREIIQHPGLREMNFGIFQGKSWQEIEEKMPDIYKQYREDDPDFTIPNGESHNQFHRRVIEALSEITQSNLGKNILIVSHGGTINKILGYTNRMTPSANRFFRTKNLALNILEYDDGRFTMQTEAELLEGTAIR